MIGTKLKCENYDPSKYMNALVKDLTAFESI